MWIFNYGVYITCMNALSLFCVMFLYPHKKKMKLNAHTVVVVPEPSSMPRVREPLRCSAWQKRGKQERTLNFLQSPANTPRHKLSTAMSASYTQGERKTELWSQKTTGDMNTCEFHLINVKSLSVCLSFSPPPFPASQKQMNGWTHPLPCFSFSGSPWQHSTGGDERRGVQSAKVH